jgi:hypothetical protein
VQYFGHLFGQRIHSPGMPEFPHSFKVIVTHHQKEEGMMDGILSAHSDF